MAEIEKLLVRFNSIVNGQEAEEKYVQPKLLFVEEMISKSEKIDFDWSRSYCIGKWAVRYLSLLELKKCGREEIEGFCRKYWENSSIRKFCAEEPRAI